MVRRSEIARAGEVERLSACRKQLKPFRQIRDMRRAQAALIRPPQRRKTMNSIRFGTGQAGITIVTLLLLVLQLQLDCPAAALVA